MSNIDINDGYYHYTVEFTDVDFIIDAELYLNAPNISDAIAEIFDDEFITPTELESVKRIEIVNYCGETDTFETFV